MSVGDDICPWTVGEESWRGQRRADGEPTVEGEVVVVGGEGEICGGEQKRYYLKRKQDREQRNVMTKAGERIGIRIRTFYLSKYVL